jgi:hypothetical protein
MGCNDCDPPPTEEELLQMEQSNTGLIEWMRSLVSGIISSTDGNGNGNFTEGTNDDDQSQSASTQKDKKDNTKNGPCSVAASRVFFL